MLEKKKRAGNPCYLVEAFWKVLWKYLMKLSLFKVYNLAIHKPFLGVEPETFLNRFTRHVYQEDHPGAVAG